MTRFVRLLSTLVCVVTLGMAAETPSAPVAPAPESSAAAPAKKRAISEDLAASLSATMPRYDPPKPVENKPEADEEDQEDVDLREADKPRNNIIRLPEVVVQGQRPGIFRERDFLTAEGLRSLSLRRYRGLSMVPFANLNAKIAVQMYEEDERLRNMSDLNDNANDAARAGDTAGSDYIRKQTNETYMRRGSPGWTNNNKR